MKCIYIYKNVCRIYIIIIIIFNRSHLNITLYFYIIAEPVEEITNPCIPSPCGANAICKEQNGAGSCTCIHEYFGNPYELCRPECTVNTDCSSNKACMGNKCVDPCPGTCAPSAICNVINHSPTCSCNYGYTGNPYTYCNLIPPPRKFFTLIYCYCISMTYFIF